MATVKINLDTLISSYIHRPTVKEDPTKTPLYARVGTEFESPLDARTSNNKFWQAGIKRKYNSPTNVRRLFIGDKKVYIQYFKPPAGSNRCWAEYSYSAEDRIGDIADKIVNRGAYVMQSQLDGKMPDEYEVTKSGIGAISKDWVMSNIEEVYITPSVLLSNDVQRDFGQSAIDVYNWLTQSQPSGIIKRNEFGQRFFEQYNKGNVKDIRARFPRLKVVAFMTNMEMILDQTGAQNMRDGLPEHIKEVGLTWVQSKLGKNKDGVARLSNYVLSIIPFEGNSETPKEFQTRPSIYRFDNEVLDTYFNTYKQRVLELARENRDKALNLEKKVEEAVKQATKSEYEMELDKICIEKGEAFVQNLLKIVFARAKKEAIDEEFSKMSTDGRKKYRDMLGK